MRNGWLIERQTFGEVADANFAVDAGTRGEDGQAVRVADSLKERCLGFKVKVRHLDPRTETFLVSDTLVN